MRQQNEWWQLLTVFHGNYGSLLVSFRNMTTGQTTYRLMSTTNMYLAHEAGVV